MNGAFHVGSIGLGSQQSALDTIADNIANMNSRSFKRTSVSFSEIMTHQQSNSAIGAEQPMITDVAGVVADTRVMLDEQGQLQQTGNSLDIAVEGSGFIEIMGPEGQTYLWRGGSMAIDSEGFLSLSSNLTLHDRINIPEDSSSIEITEDGQVFAQTNGETDAIEIGRINLVNVDDLYNLERVGNGLYKIDEDTTLKEAVPGEDGMGRLVQGSIERSNVDLNTEMVQMMIVQRAYAANAQIVQAADQMMSIANNLRR